MSDLKHTAGPWSVHNKNGINAGEFTYRPHWPGVAEPTELEANASLIAAAPDLLEALKALLPEGWGDDDHMDHMPGVKAARLAISRAEGRTP